MPEHQSIEDALGRDGLEARLRASRNLAPKSPASWKAAFALQTEIMWFVQFYGLEYCALFTLLFSDPHSRRTVTPAEAQRIFKKAARRLFPEVFVAYIAIMDFHRSGAVHLHLVVALTFPFREGWNFNIDQEHRDLRLKVKAEKRMTPPELTTCRKLCRQLTTNPLVKRLMKTLRRGLTKMGFPRLYPFELKPVRNPAGLARYLAGRFRESHARRDLRPKGSRCRRFSKSFPRSMDKKLRFSAVTPHARLYRQKCAAFGAALGLTHEGMIREYGPSWAYLFREILSPLNPYHTDGFFDDQWAKVRELAAQRGTAHFPPPPIASEPVEQRPVQPPAQAPV
jgi:hypothetical protein